MPFGDGGEELEKQIQGRAARRLELRQSDFLPAMGGFVRQSIVANVPKLDFMAGDRRAQLCTQTHAAGV